MSEYCHAEEPSHRGQIVDQKSTRDGGIENRGSCQELCGQNTKHFGFFVPYEYKARDPDQDNNYERKDTAHPRHHSPVLPRNEHLQKMQYNEYHQQV